MLQGQFSDRLGGRADVVVSMPDTTWVFELKVNGSAESAMEQINSRGYYLQYKTEGKKVVKVGVEFEQATMAVGRWVYDEGNGVVEGEEVKE